MNKCWKYLPYVVIALLPFGLFWWAMPFVASRTIGSDYLSFAIEAQLELLYSLEHGSVPLYMPGLAHGNTAAALTLGQFFHPFTHLASHMPGYWAGYSLEWLTLFRLCSLALAHLLVYLLLRRFGLDKIFALTLGVIAVYNLRMLDMFRYGASLENYTAFLFLVVSLMWYATDDKKSRAAPLAIAFSAALLVVGGHPQITYLGFLSAALLTLLMPCLLPGLQESPPWSLQKMMRYWAVVFGCTVLGMLLASAYLFPFVLEFVANNTRRVHAGYYWGSGFPDTLYGVLSNFFNAWHSDSFVAFGGATLVLLALLVPLLPLFSDHPYKRTVLLWWVLIFLVFVALGRLAPLHYLLWKALPLYSSFRAPGRIGLFTPVVIILMLTLLYRQKPVLLSRMPKNRAVHPLGILSVAGLVLFIVWNVVPEYGLVTWKKDGSGWSTPLRLQGEQIYTFWRPVYLSLGAIAFAALFAWSILKGKKFRQVCLGVLLLAVIIQSGIMMRLGGPVAPKTRMTTFQEMGESKARRLQYSFATGTELELSDTYYTLQHTFLDPRLAWVAPQYQKVATQEEAWDLLRNRQRTPNTALVEDADANTPLPVDEQRFPLQDWNASVDLTYASYNRMEFAAHTSRPGLFVTNYPFMKNWQAWVNQQPATLYRVNGLDMGVLLPEAGKHTIELRYVSPAATYGIMVSSATCFLIICWFLFSMRISRYKKRVLCLVALLACATGCALYIRSFYRSENMETSYQWENAQNAWPKHLQNAAYGKPTSRKQIALFQEILFPASKAVDGYCGPNSLYFSGPGKDLWWQVDLKSPRSLDYIEICPPRGLSHFIRHNPQHPYLTHLESGQPLAEMLDRPIMLEVAADDKKSYRKIVEIRLDEQSENITIPMPDAPIRYIRLAMPGPGILSIGEVKAFERVLPQK